MSEDDWNFDAIPNNQLVACCYWEYARESAFIRNTLMKYRDWFLAGGKRDDETPEINKNLEKIQSIGHSSHVFVRGCAFKPDRILQSDNPKKPHYRHPDAPVSTGRFPNPWRTLLHEERESRSHIRNDKHIIPIVPFKRAEWHDAQDIARWAEARWNEIHAAYEKVRRENPEMSEIDLIKQGKIKEYEGINPSLYWEGGGEVTVVSIQWSDFTNDEIVSYFRKWVKANRPKRLGNPDGRGHKLDDWRAKLTRLAAMRLLSRFTALQLVADNSFPEIWETKQFSGRKWYDVTKWHDARREAAKIFHTLFPFLTKEENPLSWNRQAPAK